MWDREETTEGRNDRMLMCLQCRKEGVLADGALSTGRSCAQVEGVPARAWRVTPGAVNGTVAVGCGCSLPVDSQ